MLFRSNSFDKSHEQELAKVCEYLFSKKGYAMLVNDFLNYVETNPENSPLTKWQPDYFLVPGFKGLPFIQQKLVEVYFKPLYIQENLSLLLRLEVAMHESSTE